MIAPEHVKPLIQAAKVLIATHPVFRLRPVGSEHSRVRLEQQDQIVAEDALIAAIARAEGRPVSGTIGTLRSHEAAGHLLRACRASFYALKSYELDGVSPKLAKDTAEFVAEAIKEAEKAGLADGGA